MCLKETVRCAQKYANPSRLNGEQDWGGPISQFNEHENLHFGNE